MPLLMETDEAARRAVDGLLKSRRFEIAFPRRLAWPLRLLRMLPSPVLFRITDRMMPKPQRRLALEVTLEQQDDVQR